MGAQAEALLTAGGLLGRPGPGYDAPRAGSTPLPAPPGLRLDRVARSSPWCALAPVAYDAGRQLLHRVLTVPAQGVVTVTVDASWRVSWPGPDLVPADRAHVVATLRWVLGLDDDLEGAPTVARLGRVLRSPTVWEDLVKVLLSTHTSVGATRAAVCRLCALHPDGAFPAPEAVLAAPPDRSRAGYREEALRSLATAVAAGSLREQDWRDPVVTDEEVRARVRRLVGFGPVAADTVLGLLGRPRPLELDAWSLRRLGAATAQEARDRYAGHGRWAGTVARADATAAWFAS